MAHNSTISGRAEAHGGVAAKVTSVHEGDEAGILRIDFGDPEESPEKILWERFFDKFENSKLALQYHDETRDGATSRFFKFVGRGSVDRA